MTEVDGEFEEVKKICGDLVEMTHGKGWSHYVSKLKDKEAEIRDAVEDECLTNSPASIADHIKDERALIKHLELIDAIAEPLRNAIADYHHYAHEQDLFVKNDIPDYAFDNASLKVTMIKMKKTNAETKK